MKRVRWFVIDVLTLSLLIGVLCPINDIVWTLRVCMVWLVANVLGFIQASNK